MARRKYKVERRRKPTIYAERNRHGKKIAKKTLLRTAMRRDRAGLKARIALHYRYGEEAATRFTSSRNLRRPKSKRGYWIKGALKHHRKGALHRRLGIPLRRRIPLATLRRAARAPGILGREARLALTLRKLRRRRSR